MSSFPDLCIRRRVALRICAIAIMVAAWLPDGLTISAQTTARDVNQYRRTAWQPEQNSSSENIHSIAQTPDGYLWIATTSNLLRFDGLHFKPLLTAEQEPLKSVLSLSVDRSGTLWFRTQNARLMHVVNGTPEVVSLPKQQELGIVAMTAAERGGLYATNLGKDTILLSGTDARKIPVHSKSLLISIAEATDHKVWVGTRDQGLIMWDGGTTRSVPAPDIDRKINCMLPSKDGHMWIGTDDGLAFWDGSQVSPRVLNGPDMLHLQILALLEDHRGDLWVGTSHGLLRYNAQGAQWLSIPHPATPAVTALIQDREGDIWFGNGPLLERLQATALIHVPETAQLQVSALYSDARGRTWLAGRNGGLSWLDATGVHPVALAGLDKDVVYSIDGRGDDIWLGRRDHGLTRLQSLGNNFKATTWTTRQGLAEDHVVSVRVGNDGTVWAGTLTRGLSRFAADRFTTLGEKHGLPSAAVNALEPDAAGRMWVGTPNGLCVVIGEHCTLPAGSEQLRSQEVLSLLADHAEGMLVGTRTGLLQVSDGRARAISFSNPSPRSVLGMAFDARGTLWLATSRGLISASSEHLNSTGHAAERVYGPDDGALPGEAVPRSRSVVPNKEGSVWIATSTAVYLTASEELSPAPAISHIESISVNGQPAPPDVASVPPGANRLSFTFSGLNLRAPERVGLRYRLEGFDHQWVEAQDDRQASYTNLPPGDYLFHLAAAPLPGEWSQNESQARITVFPFYWQRASVQAAFAAGLALILFGLYHLRTRQLLTHANLLGEERLRERTRIARDLHDTLLQGFISSVMHLHVASQELPPSSPLRGKVDPVLDLMESVIEDARVAVLELRAPESDGTQQLSVEMTEFIGTLSYPKQMSIDVCVTGRERQLPPLVFEEIRRTLQEAVQNAVRHSNAGQVQVSLDYGRIFFCASVQDNGCGIPVHMRKDGRPGHWGLSGMRERAERIHARLRIISPSDKGTTVTMRLVSVRAYSQPSDIHL